MKLALPTHILLAALLLVVTGNPGASVTASQDLSRPGTPTSSDKRTDLSVTAVSASEKVGNRLSVAFELTIVNNGPHAAEAVVLEMVIDSAALRHLEGRRLAPSRAVRCVTESLVCDIGDLAPADRLTITLTGVLPATAPLSSFGMEIRVSSRTIDSMPFDNRYYSSTFLARESQRPAGT